MRNGRKSLLALSSQEAAGVGWELRASCDPQALALQRGGGNHSHFVTLTLSPPEAAPGHSPVSPAVGCLLSHTSVLREPHPAPGKAPPAPAQLPTTSTCLEQHPEKPWGAQTWLCCRKSRNKQILLATNKIQAMTTTTNNSKKKFLPNFSFWS